MNWRANSALLAGCSLLYTPSARAVTLHHRASQSRQSHGASLRKRLHINDLITEPGTVELEWASLYSYTTGSFSMPSAVKYTPEGNSVLWGRTEYSIAFDSLDSAVNADSRATQFSDRVSIAATSVVYDSDHLDFAFAPQVTAYLRGDSGTRLGGTAIARFQARGNEFGVTAGWSAATAPSDTNPAGVWDFGGGYGRALASTGVLGRFTPHLNIGLEKSTGFERNVSAFGGIEYQVTERLAVDFSGQRYGLIGGGPDRQLLVGLTLNLGKLH